MTPAGNNDRIPAGFTYLGQFVDHDITLDLTSIGDKAADPDGIENFRTPALDLDAVYGLGPDGSRQLYARNPGANAGKGPGPKFLIGKTINVAFGGVTGDHRNDLPRSPEGFALIGDHRNDENLVVAQTHLAFLKFHNKVCDQIAAADKPAAAELSAKRAGSSPGITSGWCCTTSSNASPSTGIVARILDQGRKFYRFKKTALHAGRVLRRSLSLRPQHGARRSTATTASSPGRRRRRRSSCCSTSPDCQAGSSATLRRNRLPLRCRIPVLPSNWIIDWRRYYDSVRRIIRPASG